MKPILEVYNLSAGYENGYIIEDTAFSLNKGEFISILGRNGSGKSTLIKALQWLLKNISGQIIIEGENIFTLTPQQIARKIAYVPQFHNLYFEFTAMEIILMGRYIHQNRFSGSSPEDARIIEEVMALTEIFPFKEKKIGHLSGGEQQRVFIARALAQDTPLLFLDEPSSHLDINYQVEIYKILKRLQKEKEKTIISTEHNINLSIPYSNRLIFLKEGKIHSIGSPKDLITKQFIKEVFQADVDIRENIHSKLPEISLIPISTNKT